MTDSAAGHARASLSPSFVVNEKRISGLSILTFHTFELQIKACGAIDFVRKLTLMAHSELHNCLRKTQ